VGDNSGILELFVHLSRLSLTGRPQDVQAFLRKSIQKLAIYDKMAASRVSELLVTSPSAAAPFRDAGSATVPVDADSRMSLVRHEYPVQLEGEPILASSVADRLGQILLERARASELLAEGIAPTRSLLLVGPPGVGKTFSARWVAHHLNLPLLTLDLATVISSYLGKTGSNLRAVLDYAKTVDCVLLLDEFDAIAKRRDDDADIGELKRLVNVLLQEIDDWPPSGLLVAATNHGELLDRAVWRRFDEVVLFDLPSVELLQKSLRQQLDSSSVSNELTYILAQLWAGRSFSEVATTIQRARRSAAVHNVPPAEALLDLVSDELKRSSPKMKKAAAEVLRCATLSERRISAITGLARDTLRKQKEQPTAVSDDPPSSEVGQVTHG
jgi:SpoVK/Ycf46/Vps4 family AAA+-type ATPase